MSDKRWEPWTIVHKGGWEPVVPADCNPGSQDEGMLVYRSREAAQKAADHQFDTYEVDCVVVLLSDVQDHEASRAGRIGPQRLKESPR